MSETIDKVYCCDSSNNQTATIAALIANKPSDNNAMMVALANGGMNGWMNNPFVYLVWMMFANRFWNNGDGNQQTAVQGQLDALCNQMADNQNSNLLMDAVKGNNVAIGQLASNLNCDFNMLNAAVCNVKAGVDKVAGAVGFSSERVINACEQQACGLKTAMEVASYNASLARKQRLGKDADEVTEHDNIIKEVKAELTRLDI